MQATLYHLSRISSPSSHPTLYWVVSFFAPNILQTNENKSKEYDEGCEELKDVEANACAEAKISMESNENNTHCVSATPLFLDMFPCSMNNTYL
jgi:hypothetical protein